MFYFILSFLCLFKANDWQLHKNEDGIQVYTRKYADKSFKQVRAVMTINASLSTMTTIIKGGKEATEWADRIIEYKTLKEVSNMEWYTYAEAEIPWPFKNKDIVTKNTLTQDTLKNITIQITSTPNYIPKYENKDRIKKSEGSWIFKPLGKGKTEVTYLFYSEPDGILPQWMVTPLVVGSVFKTMQGLRKFSATDKYKNVKLSYILE